MCKYKDITGQRFGKLVAIRPTEKRKGTNVVWLFKCDCGNTVERSTSHLSSTSSCGCSNWHSLRKDITGQRFGRLVAIEPTNKRSSGGRIWRFRWFRWMDTWMHNLSCINRNFYSALVPRKRPVKARNNKTAWSLWKGIQPFWITESSWQYVRII